MSLTKNLTFREGLGVDHELILKNNNNSKQQSSNSLHSYELEEWIRRSVSELELLKAWLKKQPHLPQNLQDEQLLVFLHSCYGSVEMTKTKIDSFFTIRTHAPEIFTNRCMSGVDLLRAQKMTRIGILRGATPEGWNAIFIDCINPDMSNYNFVGTMKYASVAMDALVCEYPKEDGNVIVFDMKNTALSHVIKTNLATLKKALVYTQHALPFRLKQVHVINANPLINQIQAMTKPFISADLRKMIQIHHLDNMESFYKFIPKKCLPSDYGGSADSLQDLNTRLREILTNQERCLTDLNQQVVNESKRTGRAKTSGDVFGIEGSFKKLDLD